MPNVPASQISLLLECVCEAVEDYDRASLKQAQHAIRLAFDDADEIDEIRMSINVEAPQVAREAIEVCTRALLKAAWQGLDLAQMRFFSEETGMAIEAAKGVKRSGLAS